MKFININSAALLAAAAIVGGCSENSWNDKLDGFEVPPVYSEVQTINYTLTAADYTAIASNSTNKGLATTDEESAALAAVGTNGCFASQADAQKYIPALLSSSSFPYFTLNDGSNINITYNLSDNQPESVKDINAGVLEYKVSKDDYINAWGSDDDYIQGFAPITPASASLPTILKEQYPDAAKGEYAVISYQETDANPVFGNVGENDAPVVYLENAFTDGQGDFTIENVNVPEGLQVWTNSDRYGMVATGYLDPGTGSKENLETDAWLLSPEVTLKATANATLVFDNAVNYFSNIDAAKAEATVNVREKGGEWKQLTIPTFPEKLSFTYVNTGAIDLSAYNGKTIQIGFHYVSTTKAGTWEIKNLKLADTDPKAAPAVSSKTRAAAAEMPMVSKCAIYQYDGTEWKVPSDIVVLQPADYAAMGESYGNLSGTLPSDYLPTYAANAFPYAGEDAAKIVAYKYYANSKTTYKATELIKNNGVWTINNGATTDKFTRMDGEWSFNPSLELTLPTGNTEPSSTVYMACKDWVFTNVTKKLYPDAQPANGSKPGPPFIDYRNNAEFYSGASAYYGNVDVRASTALNNAPEGYTGYDGLSDDEITALIKKRFATETLPGALSMLYPDAKPIDGMEVTYSITFASYAGSAVMETAVYTVVGQGEFKYKSCTWFQNGEDDEWK